jgi:hypothetical protein
MHLLREMIHSRLVLAMRWKNNAVLRLPRTICGIENVMLVGDGNAFFQSDYLSLQ